MRNASLDKFGDFFVRNAYDKGLEKLLNLLENKFTSPELKNLQNSIASLPEEDLQIVKRLVIEIVNTTAHDLLFAIQERNDLEGDIQFLVDGENISELSDGLQGEIYGENGWINRFSSYRGLDESGKY